MERCGGRKETFRLKHSLMRIKPTSKGGLMGWYNAHCVVFPKGIRMPVLIFQLSIHRLHWMLIKWFEGIRVLLWNAQKNGDTAYYPQIKIRISRKLYGSNYVSVLFLRAIKRVVLITLTLHSHSSQLKRRNCWLCSQRLSSLLLPGPRSGAAQRRHSFAGSSVW